MHYQKCIGSRSCQKSAPSPHCVYVPIMNCYCNIWIEHITGCTPAECWGDVDIALELTTIYISWLSYVQRQLEDAGEGVVTRARSQKRKGKVSYGIFIPLILHSYLHSYLYCEYRELYQRLCPNSSLERTGNICSKAPTHVSNIDVKLGHLARDTKQRIR